MGVPHFWKSFEMDVSVVKSTYPINQIVDDTYFFLHVDNVVTWGGGVKYHIYLNTSLPTIFFLQDVS